MSIRMSSHTI